MKLKFEDCRTCAFKRKPRTVCSECDYGELYEDEDAPGVDAVFREEATRFGESVTTDDENRRFDADRFLDAMDQQDDDDETGPED